MNNLTKLVAIFGLMLFVFTACDKKNDDKPADTPPAEGIAAFELLYVNNLSQGVSLTPSLVWESAIASDGSEVTYTLFLDKSSDLQDGELPTSVLGGDLTVNFYTIVSPLDFGEEYQWYVLATSANGDNKISTSIFTFTTGSSGSNQPPGDFNLLLPSDGATDIDLDVGLSWQPSIDPDGDPVSYIVFFDVNPTSTSIIAAFIPGTTTPVTGLAENTTYYWDVLAVDDKGNSTWCSSPYSFETGGPPSPITQSQVLTTIRNGVSGFAGVVGNQMVILNGTIYDIGGFGIYDGQGMERNDVYKSTDGINWQMVRDHDGVGNGGFYPSEEHQALAYHNKLFVFDGNGNTIHYSVDGAIWESIPVEGVPEDGTYYYPREHHQTVVYQDKLWMIGGQYGPYDLTDVWVSEDEGINWTEVKEDNELQWAGTWQHQVVVLNDEMVLIGGRNYSDESRNNEVWSSTNGANWTYLSTPPFDARDGFQAVVVEKPGLDEVWVISGTFANEIWSSSDGVTWELVMEGEEVEMAFRSLHEAIFFDGKVWVFYGKGQSLGDMRQDSWTFEP